MKNQEKETMIYEIEIGSGVSTCGEGISIPERLS